MPVSSGDRADRSAGLVLAARLPWTAGFSPERAAGAGAAWEPAGGLPASFAPVRAGWLAQPASSRPVPSTARVRRGKIGFMACVPEATGKAGGAAGGLDTRQTAV